jgi:hypothetical protein
MLSEDSMTHRFAICLAIASLILAIPQPAAATITTEFDTVDAVEIANNSSNSYLVIVTGIRTGESAPTTQTFGVTNSTNSDDSRVRQCERFAVLAMSKPGKYRFGIGGGSYSSGGCKLTLRTP